MPAHWPFPSFANLTRITGNGPQPVSHIDVASEEAFDRNYMNALFDYGYQSMQSGEAWKEAAKIFQE